MKSKPTTLRIGTISEATLRPEDLISAFLDALDGIKLTRAERAVTREAHIVSALMHAGESLQGYRMGDMTESEIVDELTTILESHVPDYCYFGTLEGDGACFGVWPSIDSLQADVHAGEVGTDEADAHVKGLSLYADVNDGNVTLYRRAGNRWIEVWSVV